MTIVNYFRSFLTGSVSGEPEFGFNSSSDAMEALMNVTDYPDHNFTVELTDIPTLKGNLSC